MFDAWMAVADRPYVIGDFVWTAFDYLGEAGLGKAVPQSLPPGYVDDRLWTAANCGDFDICGFKRPPSFYRDAVWGNNPGVACFVEAPGPDGKPCLVQGWNWGWRDEQPSWTWPELLGKPLKVRAYSSSPKVRLSLNGRDLGTKTSDRGTRFTAEWDVPYQPGELRATAQDAEGRERGTCTLRTAGKPVAIRLTPDRTTLAADGQDLSFVTVEILDEKGTLVPNGDPTVRFTLTGSGRIAGVGNSDPRSVESFQQPRRKAYQGRCLVVVKTGRETGDLRLTAEADGLRGGDCLLHVIKSDAAGKPIK
jgi:beta-galactosidase